MAVGLLNFHIPYFLVQSPAPASSGSTVLELLLLVNMSAPSPPATGIYRDRRWAWLSGLAVGGVSVLLYLLQETVGLPGLPRARLEASRIVSLLVEASFAVPAIFRLVAHPGGGAAAVRNPES